MSYMGLSPMLPLETQAPRVENQNNDPEGSREQNSFSKNRVYRINKLKPFLKEENELLHDSGKLWERPQLHLLRFQNSLQIPTLPFPNRPPGRPCWKDTVSWISLMALYSMCARLWDVSLSTLQNIPTKISNFHHNPGLVGRGNPASATGDCLRL